MGLFTLVLEVPPEAGYSSLVRTFTLEAAGLADVETARRATLAEAAALGCETIIAQAMAESRTPIKITAHADGSGLTLSLLERGLPLDDAASARDHRWSALLEAVDACGWRSHGTGGSELRMHVATKPPESGEATEDAIDPHDSHEEPARAPAPHAYTYRRFEPEDAAQVVRIFYRTYGYHYTPSLFYDPRALARANAEGRYVSFVAEAENGEIAAHYAIRPDNAATGEGCAAVVLPEHRGHDVITQVRAAAEDGARAMGLAGYYTEPVTTHAFTQKASEHFGAVCCAIVLGASPSGLRPSHMDVTITDQRQSLTFYAKMLREIPARTIYAPPRYADVVAGRFARLGVAATLREGAPPDGRGAFSVSFANGKASGAITVTEIGTDTATRVRQATADLRNVRHAKAIFARLPLDDPGTPALADAMEADGFFFGGVQPLVLDGGRDALLLQMNLTHIDTAKLSIASDDAKALLAFVVAQRGV